MKVFGASYSAVSLALLAIQLVLVSSVAGKYLYERWTCPRVWTRAIGYDPELMMRGRYLSLQLVVDGCRSTLPPRADTAYRHDGVGASNPVSHPVAAQPVTFRADLKLDHNTLTAVRITNDESGTRGEEVSAVPDAPCSAMRLVTPVDFYLSEHTQAPLQLKAGQELWIEVTMPPAGPPRPLQVAVKQNGRWRPLAFE
jgi:hypothetical protein